MNALDELLQSPNLRELLDEGERAWNEEQKRRHAFWADADEGVKAEFILGEVIYPSPIYGRHWMASTAISRRLLPYVYDNKLSMVGYEKLKGGTLISEAVPGFKIGVRDLFAE